MTPNAARLLRHFPNWAWKAVRAQGGIGWNYEGTKGGREVLVYPASVLSGPAEDDFSTRWMVREKGADTSTTFSLFFITEARR